MAPGAALTQFRQLFGQGELDRWGYLLLLFVVAAIAIICRITSRYGVRHILDAQNR